MKRVVPAVVFFVAIVFVACGRGEPQQVVASGATSNDPRSTSTTVTAQTSTTGARTTTPTPSTTVAPTPTTATFSVRDIAVSMNDCRHGYPPQGRSGATYGCVGSFVVRLNPGVGGTVAWTADWVAYAACDDPNQPNPRTSNGTIEIPTGAAQVTGKLALFSENDFNPRLVLGKAAMNTSHVKVTITRGAIGESPLAAFYGDGDCSVAGTYTSPSNGTSVEFP